MPLKGEYEPSSLPMARDQVELYESSGGTEGTTLGGRPVIVLTTLGATSGKLRKSPVMRVEHEGVYAAIASMGGAPKHPLWYRNIQADPRVEVQDGHHRWDMIAREAHGEERTLWWDRAVEAYPDYAAYQRRTKRVIPVLILEPAPAAH